ncbi:hypothetical protein GH714_001282 [Hevea brasiliensis]|uniref:Uncharacterized protein n=1 Tax=Hevea brasiliensis TaxID=3981 RepID=A0A6A6M6B4_HEVBR|nr:hypothetical protein GH714_001282 [Hevea brasiliensis]
MANQSEITLGVGVAPAVVEHEGGRRKGREERFEEVDTRLTELDERMEELQGDMQGALNAAIDKLASEGESLRLSLMEECAALRDENRSLKEQLEWAMGKLKEVEQQVSLVAMAVARGELPLLPGLAWSSLLEWRFRSQVCIVALGMQRRLTTSCGAWSSISGRLALRMMPRSGPCALVFGGYCDGLVETEARRHGERALHYCLMG